MKVRRKMLVPRRPLDRQLLCESPDGTQLEKEVIGYCHSGEGRRTRVPVVMSCWSMVQCGIALMGTKSTPTQVRSTGMYFDAT